MRFYSIVITNPATGVILQAPASVVPTSTYTSFANGVSLPGALNIELDVQVATFATPSAVASYVRIWGISLREISQAMELAVRPALNRPGMSIAIYAGMQKGLPLANPAQSGLIVQGQIFQAFGNWIGVEQTLDLILQPDVGSPGSPKNISLNWKAGTPLAQAIANTLATAFPGFAANIKISPNLVLSYDVNGYYQTLAQFAQLVKATSVNIIGGTAYQGVDIFLKEKAFSIYDGTTPTTPKTISFFDLIGQPTWIAPAVINLKCPMRADLNVGDYITLPKSIVTTTAAAQASLANLKPTFQGTFQITTLRHVGNFRQPSADSWCTVIDAAQTQPAAA